MNTNKLNSPLKALSGSPEAPSANRGMGGLTVAFERVLSAHWVQTLRAKWSLPSQLAGYVHSCYIDKQHTLVHSRNLAFRHPDLYQDLQHYAQQQGFRLLADRREQDVAVACDRRRSWLTVFTLSLSIGAAAQADQAVQPAIENTLALFEAPLRVAVDEPSLSHTSDTLSPSAVISGISETEPDYDFTQDATSINPVAESIAEVLRDHYRPAANDPAYLQHDIEHMAEYFSRYPEAVGLLMSLKGYAWSLHYKADTFTTEVRGNQIQVKTVNVHFDSRAAAQLRSHKACHQTELRGVCIASPADALLHELLHVKSAVLKPAEFIRQGGMSSVLYPYAHEAAVIQSENRLYQSMSRHDGQYRPRRHEHSGRVVASACATCLNE